MFPLRSLENGIFFFLGLSFVSFSFFSISMLIISIEEFLPSFGSYCMSSFFLCFSTLFVLPFGIFLHCYFCLRLRPGFLSLPPRSSTSGTCACLFPLFFPPCFIFSRSFQPFSRLLSSSLCVCL